ncbi:MAG TPA: PAS domain S-box protein, partial [Ohtaekwangia sp.]|nr:PAS domain S-box protein [Ohtaekwangia sp.]
MVKSIGKSQGKKGTDASVHERDTIYPSIAAANEVLMQRIMTEIEDYAMVLLTPEGVVASWNRGAEITNGYTAAEAVGKHCRIFFPKEDKDAELPEALLRVARESGKTNHEGWQLKKDGSRFWAGVSITALHLSGSGEIIGFLKIARDLTNMKVSEDNYSNYVEQLKQRNEELQKSEQRYHSMIAEVRDYAIILLDKDGKVLDWNKGAETLKGYKAHEIVGKSFRLFYPRESKDLHLPEQLLQQAVEQDSVYHEGWRIRKDGTRFWSSVAITALHDEEGQLTGFSKVTRDLTQKKIVEDQLSNYAEDLKQKIEDLRRSEERYYKMISEVQDYAIILLNEKGEIQNWNQGAERIKGYMADEVLGKSFRIFYTKEDAAARLPDRLLGKAREIGKVNHEGWRVRKDGTRFWGYVVITALHDNDGNVIGFSKVTRDLTDKKNADDALKAVAAQLDLKNKTLERLNDQLASFTYVASHDLQAPLRKIQFFSGRLSETEELTEAGKKFVDKINSSAVHMQNLMDDLLSYSQVSNDTSPFEMIDLDR